MRIFFASKVVNASRAMLKTFIQHTCLTRIFFYVGLLCHHLDNKKIFDMLFPSACSVLFLFVGKKLECTKIYDLSEMVPKLYAAPLLWVHKKV